MRKNNQGDLPSHDLDTDSLDELGGNLSKPKIRLMQQILASPTGALSVIELTARNQITESTIRDHLRDLENREKPLVHALEVNTEGCIPRGIPRKYYAVSEIGIERLKQARLFDQVGILHDMYEAAELDLPNADDRAVTIEDVEAYPHRPTPDWL